MRQCVDAVSLLIVEGRSESRCAPTRPASTALAAAPVEDRTLVTSLQGVDEGYRVLVRVIRRDETRYRIQLQRQYQDRQGTKHIESWNMVGHNIDDLTWTLIERMRPMGKTSNLGCGR
jgi:hypothetical protein